ncbi:Hypothetical protein (Fragment) [Durusdinium trenchii]|uniref:Uncharacterized protein n=1 Tax=Durusdinium trenchii TaxID=1381693 RepID=A0ABP0P2N3_9DINO
MDTLFGSETLDGDLGDFRNRNNYASLVDAMGKDRPDFFQSAAYGWRSVAAWYKLTNGVIPTCGEDLFDQDFDRQTKCILGYVNDRSAAGTAMRRCNASVQRCCPMCFGVRTCKFALTGTQTLCVEQCFEHV